MRRCRTAARSAVRLADISTAAAGDGRPWRSAAVPAPVEGGLVFSGHVTQRSVAGDWNVNGGRLSEPGPPFWVHSTLRSRGDWCPHSARVAICRRWRAHPSLDDRLGPAGRTGPQLLRHLSAPDPAQSDDVVPGPSIGRCSVVMQRDPTASLRCFVFHFFANRRPTNCKQVRHFWQLRGRPTSVIASKIRRAAAATSGAQRWRTRPVAASSIRVGRLSRRTHLHIP